MRKKAFAFVLAFVIAAASAATLAGCGKSEDKNKKTSSTVATTKAPATTAAAESTTSGSDSDDSTATEAATVVVGGDAQSSVTPDPNYNNSSGNSLVDAVLNYTGLTPANGYYGQIYGSYTSNGVTYYSVNVFNSSNAAEGMWYVSPDGSMVMDSVSFYNQYIAPDYDADPITADDETPTYYISPNGPDNADAGDDGADNTVAPYAE